MAVPFAGYLGVEITEVERGRGDRGPARAPRAEQPRRLPARRRPLHRRRDRLGRRLRRRLRRAHGRRHAARPQSPRSPTKRSPTARSRPSATLGVDAAEALATLDAEGKVEFPCEVELTDDDGQRVATATVHWHVRLKSAVSRSAGSRRVDQKEARTSSAATRKASFSASSCASS